MEMPVNMRRMGAPWRRVRVCVIVAMGPRRILRDLVIICIHGHLGSPTRRQFQFWGHKLGLGAAECAPGGYEPDPPRRYTLRRRPATQSRRNTLALEQ